MNLGSILKQTLQQRHLTVTKFAHEAGIPAQTLYALINRDSNKADMDILLKVLTALDMDLFTFMGQTPPAGATRPAATNTLVTNDTADTYEVDEKLYDRIALLAAEEGISDRAKISEAITSYLELGFGYRQVPLRSIFRELAPKSGRSKDMDSFLL